jgi:PAS domain S-box-containing protein
MSSRFNFFPLASDANSLNTLFEQSLVGIAETDVAGHYLRVNRRYAEIAGRSIEELMSLRMLDITHPDDRARNLAHLDTIILGGPSYVIENRIVRLDGSVVSVANSIAAQRDAAGDVQSIVAFTMDLTGAKSAEARLLRSEERQAFLLDLTDALRPLSDPIAIKQTASRLLGMHLGANRAFYAEARDDNWLVDDVFNDGVTALQGGLYPMATYGQWIIEGFRNGIPLVVRDTYADERFSQEERRAQLDLEIAGALALALVKDNRMVAMLALHSADPREWSETDIALAQETAERTWAAVERAKAEEALRQSLEREKAARIEVEHAVRLRDEFLGIVSHELRTPLSAILLYGEVLRSGTLPEQQQMETLDAILACAQTQRRLIEDMLDISRIVSGKLRIDRKQTDVVTLVQKACDAIRPMADARHISLEYSTNVSSAAVDADATRIQQILSNLLNNAVKFTPSQGRVKVEVRATAYSVQIAIIDTGRGISAAFLPHVFERFRQENSSTTRSAGGLGLGLSIVKQLLELHDGTIRAMSDGEGKGSTFVVTLPLMKREEDAKLFPMVPVVTAPAAPPDALRGVKVLFVEDDPQIQRAVALILERAGAQVTAVDSADAALAKFRTPSRDRLFEVLLSDIGMPGKDGYALIREIRSHEGSETPPGHIPAIALSAFARNSDRDRAIDAGFDVHVSKPIEAGALMNSVLALLRGATERA